MIVGDFLHKRIIGVFCALILMMTLLIYRIYYIDAADYISMAAAGQGSYSLSIATTRGIIYDRDMEPLVNTAYEYVASVMPSPQAAAALLPILPEERRQAAVERFSQAMPFALIVPHNDIYAQGVDVFRIPRRYGGYQYAPHVVGYLNGDGSNGVAGIEMGYDAELKAAGGKVSTSYQIDAAGHVMSAAAMRVSRENETPLAGVVLTLDKEIQRITQESLTLGCERGAAVVMDVQNGDILAMASIPAFDQNDIAASLDSLDAPFINRAVSGYNIGSAFKVIVASAALANGIPESREYECQGRTDVGGVIFRCNNNAVHGICDMERALQVSCNAYFIALGAELAPDYLLTFCENLGFGKSGVLASGVSAQKGNLPASAELQNPAALANFSFGQGSSLASPLQMAAAISTIANGGFSVNPRLVRGTTDDGGALLNEPSIFVANEILSEKTAATMQKLMAEVVENGSGRTAKPVTGGAGGKTSSAQTGIMEDGKEIVHAWFAGFYPAEQPQYSIVIFVEGGESGEQVAAPIFKGIADGIAKINK